MVMVTLAAVLYTLMPRVAVPAQWALVQDHMTKICNGADPDGASSKQEGGRVMFQCCIAALFAGPGCRTDPSCSNYSKRAAAMAWQQHG
jgi:hypothetical protein